MSQLEKPSATAIQNIHVYCTLTDICPEGSYNETGTCEECAIGTYQPWPGQPDCYQCPSGLTTSDFGVTSQSGCIEDSSEENEDRIVVFDDAAGNKSPNNNSELLL